MFRTQTCFFWAVVTVSFGQSPGVWLLNDEAGELTGTFESGSVGVFVDIKSPSERNLLIDLLIFSSGSLECSWAGEFSGDDSNASPVANNRNSYSSLIGYDVESIRSDRDSVHSDEYITTIYINTLIKNISLTCKAHNLTLCFTCYYNSFTRI